MKYNDKRRKGSSIAKRKDYQVPYKDLAQIYSKKILVHDWKPQLLMFICTYVGRALKCKMKLLLPKQKVKNVNERLEAFGHLL